MKGLILGLVLITQTCYGMDYLDVMCGTLGGKGYNCTEIDQQCCQQVITSFVVGVVPTCIALGALYIARCRRNSAKVIQFQVRPPLPKTLSKEELERIKARLYMTTDERIHSMKRID